MGYMENVLAWVDEKLSNEKFVPLGDGEAFPKDFENGIKKIVGRIFRVYAHIYHSHFEELEKLDAHQTLNHLFKRLVLFAKMFNLMDPAETAPMHMLVDKFWSEYQR